MRGIGRSQTLPGKSEAEVRADMERRELLRKAAPCLLQAAIAAKRELEAVQECDGRAPSTEAVIAELDAAISAAKGA